MDLSFYMVNQSRQVLYYEIFHIQSMKYFTKSNRFGHFLRPSSKQGIKYLVATVWSSESETEGPILRLGYKVNK